MSRRINDGNMSGIKQDKYRNSRFEYEEVDDRNHFGGMSKQTPNTLGGKTAENRGRRSADSTRSQWSGSPFENGHMDNWNNRKGWDKYYRYQDRGERQYGGNQLNHDGGNFAGKGPRGYKRSDKSILEDVCDRLSLSPEVDASNIEVSVEDGIVFLKGSVSDRRSKKLAELEIENISGVKDVQNSLSLETKKQGLH